MTQERQNEVNQEGETWPLVYSCSGCTNVAQLANDIGLWLHDRQIAEMSSIAGIGGDVSCFVKQARSERPIVVIDGCAQSCAKKTLDRHNIPTQVHVQLAEELDIPIENYGCYSLKEMQLGLHHVYQALGLDTTPLVKPK